MQVQVAAITAMGISATLITDKHTKTTAKQSIMNEEYQIIFISPEALVGGMEWRSMLATDIYSKNLVAFVIDEAHCIKKLYVLCFNMYFIIFKCSFTLGVTVSGRNSLVLKK